MLGRWLGGGVRQAASAGRSCRAGKCLGFLDRSGFLLSSWPQKREGVHQDAQVLMSVALKYHTECFPGSWVDITWLQAVFLGATSLLHPGLGDSSLGCPVVGISGRSYVGCHDPY